MHENINLAMDKSQQHNYVFQAMIMIIAMRSTASILEVSLTNHNMRALVKWDEKLHSCREARNRLFEMAGML